MDLKFILESILFSAQKPLSLKELRDVLATAAEAEDADATVKALKKTKEADLAAAFEATCKRARGGGAQLSFGVRRRFVAIRDATGIRAVAESARRREGASAAAVAACAGNAGHHRLSPADHARGNGTDSRRRCGRHDADIDRNAGWSNRSAAPKSWVVRRFTGRRRCSWNILACAVWKICPRRMNCVASSSKSPRHR